MGLDLSLTSTGASDGKTHQVTQTPSEDPVEYRLDRIVNRVAGFTAGADLAVIEAGAFSRGAQSGAAEILSALRYMVRHRLWTMGVPFALVSPTGLKAYTAGHGKASKGDMHAAVFNRYGLDFSFLKVREGRYDVVDAFALAAMGYHALGRPLESQGPPPRYGSLLSVNWPDVPGFTARKESGHVLDDL